jgi:hypothetical protein
MDSMQSCRSRRADRSCRGVASAKACFTIIYDFSGPHRPEVLSSAPTKLGGCNVKKSFLLILAGTFLFSGSALAVLGTGVGVYGTYWNGDDTGYGGGIKLSKSLMDMVFVDGRAGYLKFDDASLEVIPLEASINLGFPGPVTPYVGVGGGYYLTDSGFFDNAGGYFGQGGVEFTLFGIGVVGELRYIDHEGSYFDGLSLNAGVVLKF